MLLLHGCWHFYELDDLVLPIVQRTSAGCGELGCRGRIAGQSLGASSVRVVRVRKHVVGEDVCHGERDVHGGEEGAGELGGSVRGGMIFN